MAVKPIVNPVPPGLSELDRSTQISRRNEVLQTTNISNEAQTVIPGRDYNKNFEIVYKSQDIFMIHKHSMFSKHIKKQVK